MTKGEVRGICIAVGAAATLLALVYIVGYRSEPKMWWIVPLTLAGSLGIGGFFGGEYAAYKVGRSQSSLLDIFGAPSLLAISGAALCNAMLGLPFGPILTATMIIGVGGAFWAWDEKPQVKELAQAADDA